MQQTEQPIGGVVKCLSNQIRRHLDAAASEAGLVELTGTQGMILHYLLRNEGRCLTQRDVEQRFQLRGATLSRLFQRMEAAGLLERRAVSRDQRCKQLLPTEKARAMHAQFVTCLDETDRLLLQGIRPEDEAVFRSVCLQMLNNLTQQDAAGPAAHREPPGFFDKLSQGTAAAPYGSEMERICTDTLHSLSYTRI